MLYIQHQQNNIEKRIESLVEWTSILIYKNRHVSVYTHTTYKILDMYIIKTHIPVISQFYKTVVILKILGKPIWENGKYLHLLRILIILIHNLRIEKEIYIDVIL